MRPLSNWVIYLAIGCQQSSGLGDAYVLAASARRAGHCKEHCDVHTPTCQLRFNTLATLSPQARPPPTDSFASLCKCQTLRAMDLLASDLHACDTTRVLFLRATTLVKRDQCASDQVLQLVSPTL
jgi:hypothetical protein